MIILLEMLLGMWPLISLASGCKPVLVRKKMVDMTRNERNYINDDINFQIAFNDCLQRSVSFFARGTEGSGVWMT